MFLLDRPSEKRIKRFLSAQQHQPFSYAPLGITRHRAPSRYKVDHNRLHLGSGSQCFRSAVNAIRDWKIFDLGWVNIFWPETPIEVGATVAVVVNHLRFYSMNACRIVYVVEEQGSVERYGFAYGTLLDHAERGEERFTVEWNKADDTVWYDILAYSQPRLWTVLGYPYARKLQRRFAKDSKRVMMMQTRSSTNMPDRSVL